MRYQIFIVFSDSTSVVVGAETFGSALNLVDHLVQFDIHSLSIRLNSESHD